jgi:hypothetical protein
MKVTIKTPCSVAWEEWKEGETVRFCDQCKLNVHNLSTKSDKEVKELLKNKTGRLCVFMYKRQDGSVVTDNCPVSLRMLRTKIRAWVACLLLLLTWVFPLLGKAQGVVGAPVDPRYGCTGEVGTMEDFGYSIGRTWVLITTAVSFLVAFFVPLAEHKKSKVKVIVLEFFGLAAIPILVYLIGTFIVNSWL